MISLTPVQSSTIEAIGHDPETGTLHVKFKSGGRWAYGDVSAAEYDAMRTADSIGKHFHAHVRGKKEGRKHDEQPGAEAAAG